jgi:hypothetical protein
LPQILSELKSIANATDPLKFAYQSISYKPFLSLFNMTGAAQQHPELAEIGEAIQYRYEPKDSCDFKFLTRRPWLWKFASLRRGVNLLYGSTSRTELEWTSSLITSSVAQATCHFPAWSITST